VACPLNCKCEVACHLLYQYFVMCLGHRRMRWDVWTVRRTNTVLIMSLPFVISYCSPQTLGKVLLQVLETWPTLQWHNSSNIRVFAVMLSPLSSTKYLLYVYNSPVSLVIQNISKFSFLSIKTTQQSTIPVLETSYLLNGKSNIDK
jgi:uncharacterized protein YlbG (UPF0298 family)